MTEVKSPIMEPVHNFRHFFDKECSIRMDRIACQNPGSLGWNVFLDVVEDGLLDMVKRMGRFQTGFSQTRLW